MSEIYTLDIAAANNNSAPPNGAPEFMEYEQVNDTLREFMAAMKRWQVAAQSGVTSAGTQPAYTLTSGQTIGAYANGQTFAFLAHATSTGNVTLNVDGLGAVAVRDTRGNQLGSGDIQANGIYVVRKSSDRWVVVGAFARASIQALVGTTLASAPTTGGTSNAFTVTTGVLTAYANGQIVAFVADRANTGAATINVDGLGAESLLDIDGAALASGDIATNQGHIAFRIGGAWRVIAGLPVNLATQVVGALPIANGGTGQTSGAPVPTVGQGKQTIWVPATAMTPRTTNGAAIGFIDSGSNDLSFSTLDFDPTTAEHAHFSIALPKQWNESTVTFQPFWTASAGTATQTAILTLAGVAISNDDVLNASFGTAGSSSDALIATGDLHVGPESSAITIGGTPAEDDLCVFQLSRDISDLLAADLRLIGIKLFITTNATTDA